MLKIPIFDQNGKKTGDFEFDPALLGGTVRKRLLKEAVLMYEANQRQGTNSTLTRAQVAGTGKKMFRQKGSGNARMGQRQTPIRRGGGAAFGPKPRDYSYSINKKGRREALKTALLAKMIDGELLCLDDLKFSKPSTKSVSTLFKKLNCGHSVLIGLKQNDEAVYKSARNIPRTQVSLEGDLNAYDVIRPKTILLTREALEALKARFSK